MDIGLLSGKILESQLLLYSFSQLFNMTDSEYNGKKVIIYLKVTQAAKHILPHKLIVKTYVKLVVIIGRGS